MIQSLKQSFGGIPVRIWLLCLVNFINRIGAMVICFLTLYLTEHLHFTLKEAGYAMTFYGLGAIAGSFTGGYFTDKWGYQRVQLLSLTLSGTFLIGLMFVQNFYALCVTLFFYNLVSESFRPANSIAIKVISDDSNRTRAYSLMRTSFNLAITFALTLGGLLIMHGWHFIFVADALTCFAAAGILFFFVPVVKQIPSVTPQSQAENVRQPHPLANPTFRLFFILTLLNALVFMQILWTVPPFFKNVYHWNEDKIGLISALNGAIVMLVEMPLIFRIENKKRSIEWVKWGVVLYGLAYLSFLIPLTWLPAILYMVFISFGEIFVMPFSTTWVTRQGDTATQGKYMGMYSVAYSTANTLAPLLGTQIISNWGYNAFWSILSGLCVGLVGGFYYLGKKDGD